MVHHLFSVYLILTQLSASIINVSAFPNQILNAASATLLNNSLFALNTNNNPVFIESLNTRIINGENAKLGQFPWQVALRFDGKTFCGGSLIDYSGWILTAAHCIDKKHTGEALLGTVSVASWTNSLTILSMKLHPNYNQIAFANDIGLVKINPIRQTNNIRIISLDHERLQPQLEVTVSGWGKTNDSDQSVASNLKYISMTTISNSVCQRSYSPKINDGIVCATSTSGKSTCQGDNGGPLIRNNIDNNPVQVGVVSFVSSRGCEVGAPTGYTRVGPFTGWINFVTGLKL